MPNYQGFQPLPKKVYGWNSTAPVFRDLITKVRPSVIVEVGTWLGASAIHMADICKELGLNTKIYCVDTWLGAVEFHTMKTPDRDLMFSHGYPQVYYQFLSNVIHSGHEDMIIPVPNTSRIGAKLVPNADLIYIDASHSYEDVKDDVLHYLPKLNKDGIMFGDDYNNSQFEVKRAVDEVLGDKVDTKYKTHWVCKLQS